MTTHQRQGATLIVVLVILFTLMAAVSGMQFLASTTIRQSRLTNQLEAGRYRADGLLEMIVSRWKKRVQYRGEGTVLLDRKGSETGRWDGQVFDLAWRIEALEAAYPTDRAAVWIRFRDEPVGRCYRYDLILRTPFLLKPRVVEIAGFSIDTPDPSWISEIDTAFEDDGGRAIRSTAAQARVESISASMESVAARGGDPAELLPALSSSETPGLTPFLDQLKRLEKTWQVKDRLRVARDLLEASRSLSRRWSDLAHFELARSLIRNGSWESGNRRQDLFQEALSHLEEALDPQGACCGEPMVTWHLANLMMRMRVPLHDPGVFTSVRAAAYQRVADVARANPDRFVHERTDIRVEELPIFLDAVWRSRVGSMVMTRNESELLLSMLEDGSGQLLHLQPVEPMSLLNWEADGANVILGTWTFNGPPPPAGETIWRVPIYGTEPEILYPGSLATAGIPKWTEVNEVLSSPGGGFVVGGRVSGALPGQPDEDRRLAIRASAVLDCLPGNRNRLPYSPIAFSPDGEKVACLVDPRDANPDCDLVTMDADQFWSGQSLLAQTLGSDSSTPAVSPGDVAYPLSFGNGNEISRIDWKRFGSQEWIAVAEVDWSAPRGRIRISFLDPGRLSGTPAVDRVVEPVFPASSDTSAFATLVQSPAGFLVATQSSLHFVDLPPSMAPPRNLVSTLSKTNLNCLTYIKTPPWGETVFLIACKAEWGHEMHRVDLSTGRTEVLIGPGGVVPNVTYVADLEVSPIPEHRQR